MKKILVIMTGSIAAFKVCQLISRLVQSEFQVQVVMTDAAKKFVGEATIEGLTGRKVISSLWSPGDNMEHIHLMRWADVILAAPATGNFINSTAAGIAVDLATTMCLAHDFTRPFFIAPAMNHSMYNNPITQTNINELKKRGFLLLESSDGQLACGEVGVGRLMEPDLIFENLTKILKTKNTTQVQNSKSNQLLSELSNQSKNHKILITAGGTEVPIDNVRAITNTSSGETGARIADFFSVLGYEVHLIRAYKAVRPSNVEGIKESLFRTADELESELKICIEKNDYKFIFQAAAISDFDLKMPSEANPKGKIESSKPLTLELLPRKKTLLKINEQLNQKQTNDNVIAFKLTSGSNEGETIEAIKKLFSITNVKYVIHNDIQEINKKEGRHYFSLWSRSKKEGFPPKMVDKFQSIEELLRSLI